MRDRARAFDMTPQPVDKRTPVGDVTWLTRERAALAPFTCVELTKATFEQGVQSLRGLQEAALKRHELPPNVLVVMRSQHMPWRIRKSSARRSHPPAPPCSKWMQTRISPRRSTKPYIMSAAR